MCLAVMALAAVTHPATAQERAHSARAAVQSPHALAMGNAAAAFPSLQSVFFYNPAHLVNLTQKRAPIVLLGFNGSASRNFAAQLDFYNNELEPALDAGLESLGAAEQQALFEETMRLGQRRTFAGGDLLLPSVAMRRGNVGFGGGLFATTELRYLTEASSSEVPVVDLVTQADIMALAAGAVDLSDAGLPGLSLGVTAKYTQRYLVLKNKPLNELDGGNENFYMLGSGALGADVGLHYRTPAGLMPGRLHLAAVLYDAVGSAFDYKFSGYYAKNTPEDDPRTIEAEERLAQERLALDRSYRLGAAYTLPQRGPLAGSGIAVDYLQDPGLTTGEALSDHLRLGAQLTLSSTLALRGGLNRGKPTVGGGLRLADFVLLDYAYHNVQERGLPPGWTHTVQLTFGSF